MAEDFLEEIYRESKILCELREVVRYARVNDPTHLRQRGNILLSKLCDVYQRYVQYDAIKGKEFGECIKKIGDVGDDAALIGDIFEYKILPLLEDSMRQWGDICTENDEGDYQFETSVSGFLTVKDLKKNSYLHSTVDPMWEAKQLAERLYDARNKQYSIKGCGLGYLIYQLYEVSNGSVMLNVYENDPRMVQYARQYGVLDWVPEENLRVTVGDDPLPFLDSALEDDTGVYFFAPALKRETEEMRTMLEEVAIQYISYYMHQKDVRINYWNNRRSNGKMISELDVSQIKKDVIIIAGGPSVDDNMEFLRENQGKMTLIAVGTIFRKLVANNIIPDFVTALDPDPVIYKQFEGLEEQKVPILLTMVTYWKIAAAYQGEKYFIPLKEMESMIGYPLGEEYEDTWSVGDTVTNIAIISAIKFGAENVYLVGVDMAYPGGITHAEGTAQRETKNVKGRIPMKDVNGGTVYTDKSLYIYHKQIEEFVRNAPKVAFYNMSQIGAYIAGTKSYEDALKKLGKIEKNGN